MMLLYTSYFINFLLSATVVIDEDARRKLGIIGALP